MPYVTVEALVLSTKLARTKFHGCITAWRPEGCICTKNAGACLHPRPHKHTAYYGTQCSWREIYKDCVSVCQGNLCDITNFKFATILKAHTPCSCRCLMHKVLVQIDPHTC